ncbi:helix-turn-helix domain-containing protein [Paenibacillus agaridevorans]|uniref:helix-turn-helix domain-containing protein n=1 Tax=Paenibacillus agaridevorans TaxID=171404 RepID=UPI001BE4BC83|nr:helix-turn-helix transcriptional regulator [Paenibacillus agaridevorans]
MFEISRFLRELRGRRKYTLREASERSGLSHSYISSLENGKHPKTKAPINPSPESLKRLSEAYNYDFETLMKVAGYIEGNGSEELVLSESSYDMAIKEAQSKYGVNLRENPVANATIRELLLSLAKQESEKK